MPPLKKERRGVGTHPVTQSRDPPLKTAENPLSLSLIVFGIDSTDYPSLFHPSVLGVRPFERGVQTLSNIIAVGELRERAVRFDEVVKDARLEGIFSRFSSR